MCAPAWACGGYVRSPSLSGPLFLLEEFRRFLGTMSATRGTLGQSAGYNIASGRGICSAPLPWVVRGNGMEFGGGRFDETIVPKINGVGALCLGQVPTGPWCLVDYGLPNPRGAVAYVWVCAEGGWVAGELDLLYEQNKKNRCLPTRRLAPMEILTLEYVHVIYSYRGAYDYERTHHVLLGDWGGRGTERAVWLFLNTVCLSPTAAVRPAQRFRGTSIVSYGILIFITTRSYAYSTSKCVVYIIIILASIITSTSSYMTYTCIHDT